MIQINTNIKSHGGVRVKPLSQAAIRSMTLAIRKRFGFFESYYFPVVEFLENVMPEIFTGFNYEYVEKMKMGGVEGLTIPETNTIRIREDVYEAAMRDEGRARFTIAHEIGHYVMHKNQVPGFSRTKEKLVIDHKVFEDSEWQANAWAGELLMPYHLIHGMTIYEIVEKCKVSGQAAEYRRSKLK